MHYLFGGMKEKEQKSIENDQFPQKLAVVLRKQFCMICGSSPSTKIAFGQGVKPAFTCNSCELKAVGGVVQKMTEKNLIDNQKFAQILTTSLIGYQKRQVLSIPHFKQGRQIIQAGESKCKQLSEGIKEQLKRMKQNTKVKANQLISESEKQNTVPTFDLIAKQLNDKKPLTVQNAQTMVKRSQVNYKGLDFTYQEEMHSANNAIAENSIVLKIQSTVNMKQLCNWIEEIDRFSIE